MPSNRIAWIDALKGFGMILVILGHMSIPEMSRQLIFSFHMPLFFFVSGYLFKNNFSLKWSLRKIDSLFVPYVVYGALTLLIWVYVGKIDFHSGARMLVRGNGLGLTWFLSCMLMTELIGGVLLKGVAKVSKWCLWLIVIALAVFGWILPQFHLPSYFKSNVISMSLAFWLTGWLLREHEFKWYELGFAVICASFFWWQRIDMNSASYGNGFLFVGTALGFVVLFLWWFRKCQIGWRPLTFIGERSLEFMCLHGLIPMLFMECLVRMGWSCSKPVLRLLYLIVVVALAFFIHRSCSLLSGRMQIFQRFCK